LFQYIPCSAAFGIRGPVAIAEGNYVAVGLKLALENQVCDCTTAAVFRQLHFAPLARNRSDQMSLVASIQAARKRTDRLAKLICVVACSGMMGSTIASAQESAAQFPARDITIIVPFGAGGPPDSVARVVAAGLSQRLGKPVIVENRPGASSGLASRATARAEPNGYTLMAVDISFAVAPHIASNLGTDLFKDFKPIGLSAKSVFTLLVAPSLGVSNLAEFIKLAQTRGQDLQIGHTGVGTTPYLAAVTFMRSTGINPLLVPYRAVAEATNNVVAGHIAGVFSAASTAVGVGDKAKVLGVTGSKRLASLPDVPTFQESGIQMIGFENGSWYGLVAPAGTPDSIIAKLNSALMGTVQDQAVATKLMASGLELSGSSPAEFGDFIKTQYIYWGETLRAAGIEPEPK
jgi:tripartite-type tricarboxylate transporter receptor subunit TctC